MILERLDLERVRRFSPRFSCTFGPGLNAVLGPNESGKSTIFAALQAALFLEPKSTREEVRSLYAWGEDRPFTLRVQFREEGFRYVLWKDFDRKEVLLEEQTTGKIWMDPKSVQHVIGEVLGLSSQHLFAASASVAQGRLVVSERGKDRKALEEALAGVITGGGHGAGAARAIELLAKDIQSLTVGLKEKAFKRPGPIKSAEERLAALHGRHHKVHASYAQRVSSQEAFREAEGELKDLGEALELKRALMEVESERKQVEASLQEDKRRYEEVDGRLRALEENANRARSIEQKVRDLGSAGELEDEDLAALRAALMRRDSLTRPLEEARQEVETTAAPGPWGALVLGAFGVAAPLVASLVSPWPIVKSASVAVGLVALAGAAWLWYRRKAALEVLAERQREARRSESELEEAESRVRDLVERAGGGDPEGVLRKATEADRARGEVERLSSERKGLLRGQPEEALEAQRSELVRRMAVAEERLGEERFSGPALDAERFAELRREVGRLGERREELTRRVERLRGTLESSADEAEELAELEEKIEETKRELARWRERLKVREVAKAALEEAQRSALEPALERLQENLARYFGAISSGRYGAVRLGDSSADLEVRGPEREEFVQPRELSFGTVEQLMLAARLTFTELLAGHKRPPMLLDEPFGAFDEERLRSTMGLLANIAAERQVILFTHQEEVAAACDHVVRLPPPARGG